MSIVSRLKKTGAAISRAAGWIADRIAYGDSMSRFRLTRRILIVIACALPVYYVAGMLLTNKVDDDTNFELAADVPPNASRAAAMAALLVEREVNDHGWQPNAHLLSACTLCDNMANFQRGIARGLGQYARALTDAFEGESGTPPQDPDLQAVLLLQESPDHWSLLSSADTKYLQAANALKRINARIAKDDASYKRDAQTLARQLKVLATGLDSDTDEIFSMVTGGSGWYLFDWSSDNLFYRAKGRIYVHYMILRELQSDYAGVLKAEGQEIAFTLMLKGLRAAVESRPMIVMNGATDSSGVPNHLTALGFHTLRAKGLLDDIIGALES